MAKIQLSETILHTYGELPQVGEEAPNFRLTAVDLSTVDRTDFAGKAMLLNVYPSLDTAVCYSSAKKFNDFAKSRSDLVIACISVDLPFSLQRIQENASQHLDSVQLLSDYKNRDFGACFGLIIADGPIGGMLARAVIVLDHEHRIAYHQLVSDVTEPPNYDKAIACIQGFKT
jgi:thioredoxin-dependent peroxiredoxin